MAREDLQMILFSVNQFRFQDFLRNTRFVDIQEIGFIDHPISGAMMGMIVNYKAGTVMNTIMLGIMTLLMDKEGRWRRDELMRMGYLTERKQ